MSAALKLAPAPDDAAALLDLLAPGEPVTFQTFDDTRQKRPTLASILHGTLTEHRQRLANANANGAGVFFMVNAGNGKGRKAANVRRVRALFADLDGAPLEPVQASPLPAHAIVESSPGRWHAYWRIADCPPGDFKPMQKALAARFNADASVCDLPRVMRLPGFEHRKGQAFRSRIIALRHVSPYTFTELRAEFALPEPSPAAPITRRPSRRVLPDRIVQGERNATLLSLAAGLVRKGYVGRAVADRLQTINAQRYDPPLGADEVAAIAARACAYGSDGFTKLPHALLDSLEWKALAPGAHDVVLQAFRRFDGSNNGRIALTWADFEAREGFGSKQTFLTHRTAAAQSGILLRVSEGRRTQTGRTPDLYGIAGKWLQTDHSE